MPDSAAPTGELGTHTDRFWADLAGSAGGSGSAVDPNAIDNGPHREI